MGKQFEYKKADIVYKKKEVQELGMQGWELVNVMPSGICYLKREVTPSPSQSQGQRTPAHEISR
jgi:hypothetical protein